MFCIIIHKKYTKQSFLYPVIYNTAEEAEENFKEGKKEKKTKFPYSKQFNNFEIKEII